MTREMSLKRNIACNRLRLSAKMSVIYTKESDEYGKYIRGLCPY